MNLSGGTWHNEYGFTLRDTGRKARGCPPWRKRTIYEYTADHDAPLTYQFCNHGYLRPDKHGFTDLGSVPEILQLIIAKDLHNPSFIVHDSGCIYRGLWFSASLYGTYTFCPMGSRRMHELLDDMLTKAGYTRRGALAESGCRAFGPRWR